jgi:CXXX repeat peptide maturase
MEAVKSLWVLLSQDSVQYCNESSKPDSTSKDFMSQELFSKIVRLAEANSWSCTVLCNSYGFPKDYDALCSGINFEIVLPATYVGNARNEHTTVVFESSQTELFQKHKGVPKAILRLQRKHLPLLSEMVLALLNHFNDISIRHPELLSYDDEDMTTYTKQLFEIGRSLLDKKEQWSLYRVDCLTDRFHLDSVNTCGAGVTRLAVGPDGKLYICPAAARSGWYSCGHILENVEIPNRYLLTRKYSVTCGKCEALHCVWCVYMNKLGTLEFCVPPRNVCRLAHFEQEVQAWLAQELIEKGLWNQSLIVPAQPKVYDPYELVKAEDEPPLADSWRRLVKFDGLPQNLRPAMMLDIIHGLQGWLEALVACAEAGYVPSVEVLQQDVLSSLRRRTIEQYRDVIFQEGCPSVREIELLMRGAVEKALTS